VGFAEIVGACGVGWTKKKTWGGVFRASVGAKGSLGGWETSIYFGGGKSWGGGGRLTKERVGMGTGELALESWRCTFY